MRRSIYVGRFSLVINSLITVEQVHTTDEVKISMTFISLLAFQPRSPSLISGERDK